MTDQTPLMAQYRRIKAQYDDCVLLFRVGDFYETFYEDAVDVARVLNIALTTRDKKKANPIPLAGVPFHAAEGYVTRLLAAGRKVAICEQVEDASKAKGLVRREVTEVLTPGTSMNAGLLEEVENNYCMSIAVDGRRGGVALIDVSTGDFLVGEADGESLRHLLQGKRVREVVWRRGTPTEFVHDLLPPLGSPFVTELDGEIATASRAEEALARQFGARASVETLRPLERAAAGVLLAHCQALRRGVLAQVSSFDRLGGVAFLALDDETIRNLELFEPLYGGERNATLIHLIDRTVTAMGGRELRGWMQKPLCNAYLIDRRLDAVGEIYGSPNAHERLVTVLRGVHDIQRVASRIAARKAIPRELHALRESLEKVPQVGEALGDCESALLRELVGRIGDHSELARLIARAVIDDPPGHLREGGVIRKGYAADVDALIERNEEAKRWIASLERRERERTGIGSLKVAFNRVFGYYIEVSKAHRGSVPDDYIAKQTLVNAERYYTQDLKEREQQILDSEEKRIRLEQKAFEGLCARIADEVTAIQVTAHAIAQIDVIQSLAATAKRHGFRRPVVDDATVLELVSSRHPVLEGLSDEPFVPNDLSLDVDRRQFALITGPNMSGKSTFLRQVALCVVLSQMGSFVPADRARIGVVDKIFTRVGASDRLARGESTFLVEMKETAHILDNMTERSLVLLDEVGRGTSTFDGLSIAWAVTEYLLQGVAARPKTLFATHFHELTQLRNVYPRLVNLKITIREWEGGVIFLRKIVAGTSDRSYGIHAAKVAGLPAQVLKRAEEILRSLELRQDLFRQGVVISEGRDPQYNLFGKAQPRTSDAPRGLLESRIREFDVDNSTPLGALEFVHSLKQAIDDGAPDEPST